LDVQKRGTYEGLFKRKVENVKTLYIAQATVEGGREGHGRTSDGRLEVDLSVPEDMGGRGGSGTNPEQLFAVGYAACFQSGAPERRQWAEA
jgi:organic hydroperoxide reductase OsmC/OhrA